MNTVFFIVILSSNMDQITIFKLRNYQNNAFSYFVVFLKYIIIQPAK